MIDPEDDGHGFRAVVTPSAWEGKGPAADYHHRFGNADPRSPASSGSRYSSYLKASEWCLSAHKKGAHVRLYNPNGRRVDFGLGDNLSD